MVNLPGQHQLWSGDANSILKGYNLGAANPPVLPPPQIANIPTGAPTDNRADEMAFDPADKLLMVTNNAPGVPPGSQPAFVSIIDTTTNTIVAKTVFDGTVQHGAPTPNATGATEQPAWIGGTTQKFFLSLPQVNGTGPGGIVQLDITGKVTHFYDFASFGISACSPSGLVVGQNNVLGVNCQTAGSQVLLFDPNANGGNGALVKTFPQFSAGDEAWFDPGTGFYFFAENNNLGGPVLGIIDGNTNSFLQVVPTSQGAHSVAVDPVSGEVFVPEGGGPPNPNSVCPQGCIRRVRQRCRGPGASFLVADPDRPDWPRRHRLAPSGPRLRPLAPVVPGISPGTFSTPRALVLAEASAFWPITAG